ncbi:helix-turn-helix domain-containing protein [Chryseolinea lacunae]|uniref:Helix-turn-helix domain-containing protein n=1 Tax=Chryseolinea lacunae TaxID=2801331 RepID=A0ABS1KLL2_9BACT|nr:AraC family transcriptional regulator [Chryseolinea lacunae]MBL0740355.1 helix-turn-helix domain-containing protein [Chryseolinea lacunae]
MNLLATDHTPVYCLDSFSKKANDALFYIEDLQTHLREHAFVSEPHRHDFYLLLYVTHGGGEHVIDFEKYTVSPGSYFVMTPGQVHAWNLEPGTDGYILFFVPEFYRMAWSENSLLEFPFFHSLHPHPHILLSRDADAMPHTVITEMHREFHRTSPVDLRLLRSYLDVVLLKLSQHYRTETNQVASQGLTFKLRKLEEMIDAHYTTLKQPRDYAESMHLSASYLNNLCKKALGKTLSDLIHERVILEAKRYFAYSDLTVAEIAAALKFSESSYFIRFFKKETGLTPEQFKESLIRAIK